jgi:hypothetical protein
LHAFLICSVCAACSPLLIIDDWWCNSLQTISWKIYKKVYEIMYKFSQISESPRHKHVTWTVPADSTVPCAWGCIKWNPRKLIIMYDCTE